MLDFIKPLFCENSKLSLGRISWWIVLTPALKLWWTGSDIQTHHIWVLGFLLCYNCYSKLPQLIEFVKAIRGAS